MKKLSFKVFILILLMMPVSVNLSSDAVGMETYTDKLNYEKESCIALNYHRVRDFSIFDRVVKALSNSKELSTYSVSDNAFKNHMEWLIKQNASFVTMEELLEAFEKVDFPDRCVWVNFDDMDQSIYDSAHPILLDLNIPATGFVITGEVGNADFNNLPLLDEHSLKEMENSGIWEFESHTHKFHNIVDNNSILLNKSPEDIYTDVSDSLNYLNDNFNCACNSIAYPYGQSNDKVTGALENAGIEYGFTLEEKAVTGDSNPFYIPRVLISESAFENLVKNWEGFN